eukprot:CAMPEP_0183499676 /NCGR_PEP_ID=MMETSP0371-20130417/1885_1 /TAXON_ID=268820 /ORGANISM="Peridinium aciculiferum, Strain PAER-2" /LENGTH=42 /DNA_ID= /DNA_START= /DNA_END= /DNA_ORIENTATION=
MVSESNVRGTRLVGWDRRPEDGGGKLRRPKQVGVLKDLNGGK